MTTCLGEVELANAVQVSGALSFTVYEKVVLVMQDLTMPLPSIREPA